MKKESKSIIIKARLSQDEYDKLCEYAQKNNKNVSSVIRDSIEDIIIDDNQPRIVESSYNGGGYMYGCEIESKKEAICSITSDMPGEPGEKEKKAEELVNRLLKTREPCEYKTGDGKCVLRLATPEEIQEELKKREQEEIKRTALEDTVQMFINKGNVANNIIDNVDGIIASLKKE